MKFNFDYEVIKKYVLETLNVECVIYECLKTKDSIKKLFEENQKMKEKINECIQRVENHQQ